MKRLSLLVSPFLLVAACKAVPARSPAARAEPAAVVAPGASYGSPIDPSVPEVALAELARDPSSYAGRRVRARGTVHRVCQRAGCWMELEAEGVTPIFVPMAGHAFFLPREAQGQLAEVEGTIELRTVSAGERAHLESEGATTTDAVAQLVAAGVRLEGAPRRQGASGRVATER